MRIRSGYSFKHAVGHIDEIMDRLVEIGYGSAPITDRMSTYSYVRWTKLAKEKGLKPIYGVEIPVTAALGDKRPVVDWWTFIAIDELRPLHDLIYAATTNACEAISYEQAQAAPGLMKIIGEKADLTRVNPKTKNLYMALSPSLPRGLYVEGKKRKFRFVACSDNVYTGEADKEFYRIALYVRASTQTYPQHILSDAELTKALWYADPSDVKAAFTNRLTIAMACNVKMKKATLYVPEKKKTLRAMCVEGAKKLGVDVKDKIYAARLTKELALIEEKNFEDYFYIIADLMRWSRERMIVGPARGSSCGSLVCYLLGITAVDPIRFDLVFERFIDTTRADLPDIDLDFSDERRHLALEYVSEKYGAAFTARLGSVNNTQQKSALNAVGLALRIPSWQVNEVGNTVVKRSAGDSRVDSTIIDTLTNTEVGQRMVREFPACVIADRLERHPTSAGQHAAGVVLTKEPVLDFVAIDGRTGATMCDKKDAEELNLLKIDMLGLTQLSVFEQTLRLIGEEPRSEFFEKLPMNASEAFEQLNERRFSGIFQFVPGSASSNLVSALVTRGGAIDDIEDIVSLTALVRPGPLNSGAAEEWLRRRCGMSKVTYIHPTFEPYVKSTLGIIVYQEQVMQIGREIGGLTWDDVTALRKAMSRSLGKEFFDQYGDRWKAGAKKTTGMASKDLDKVWDDLCNYGSWAFNRSHSVAYGIISYWCCWLKAHFPVEFAAATLDSENDQRKQVTFLREMRDEGIDYVAIDPDISTDRWTTKTVGKGKDKKRILVGPLGNIKGVGEKIERDILDARRLGIPLRPSIQKKLTQAKTSLDSLTPIADRVDKLHPDLSAIGIVSSPMRTIDIAPNGSDEGHVVMILARVLKVKPLDENEPQRVQKRGGRTLSGPTAAVNVFFEDDFGDVFCKIGRYDFERFGRRFVQDARAGKSLYAVKGVCPGDFRMIRITQIKYLGEMD